MLLPSLAIWCATISCVTATNKHSFPAVAALEYAGGRVLCSSVVLTDRFLLTAAHCVCQELPTFAFIGRTIFQESEPGRQWRLDLTFDKPSFFSPDFCERYSISKTATMRGADLALLRFTQPLSEEIVEAVLGSETISDGSLNIEQAFAVGWGESNNFWRPGRKNYATLNLTARLCSEADQQQSGCKAGVEALAANPPHDTCFADSGGGLYGRDSEGIMHLLGITSRSSKETPDDMCGAGGIYTSLEAPPVREWLLREITGVQREHAR